MNTLHGSFLFPFESSCWMNFDPTQFFQVSNGYCIIFASKFSNVYSRITLKKKNDKITIMDQMPCDSN